MCSDKLQLKEPEQSELDKNLNNIANMLDKAYWELAKSGSATSFADNITYSSGIRAVRISSWVYDKNEKIVDCFKNVLSVFSGSGNTLGLVIKRTASNVEMFFITQRSGDGQNEYSKSDIELLEKSLLGNFPGSKISRVDSSKTGDTMGEVLGFRFGENDGKEEIIEENKYSSIACACNIPSDKSVEYVSQGIDKLLNGLIPKNDESYAILILGKAWTQNEIREILLGYQELATAIAPFSGYQFQVGENSTKSMSEMETLTHSEGINNAITKTNGCSGGIGAAASINLSKSLGRTVGHSSTNSKSYGSQRGETAGISAGTTYTFKSYAVSDLISKLELEIDRIKQGQATGLWSSAAYILAKDAKTSKSVARFLQSLTLGDDSFVERSFVQEWSYQTGNATSDFKEIKRYLNHFSHPIFKFDDISATPTVNITTGEMAKLFAFPKKSIPGIPVTECAEFGRNVISHNANSGEKNSDKKVRLGCIYHMRKPEEATVELDTNSLTAHTFITGSTGSGKSNTIYKMLNGLCPEKKSEGKPEESCGEAPSDNTESKPKANDNSPHFLVIEPAKGEYKDVFGGRSDVEVYGTNFKKTPLLRLNPFSFPDDIHVLEHIDRLIEVFNACWPMYAAMPAVLKDAMEESYRSCGWDLTLSKCAEPISKCAEPKYPTFETLLKKLPEVMDSSAYSKDTKGDYTGALVTRVKSLTNGINGQIFCSGDELTNEDLFDRNVIVDLSRVGSMETKALLMGILMIKLQEHRMAEADKMAKADKSNAALRHVTVLEEAHNLLRRTSSEQSQDSSNLQGKSVEMLANAIAEMRTYGEGFIIADQAPGLLDMAVIRNTNTKIIMRLPDESDRILVGKAAGLTDEQIVELSKLDCGVAAVFQNHWLEAVLCKVDEFTDKDKKPYSHSQEDKSAPQVGAPQMNFLFGKILGKPTEGELFKEQVDKVRTWIDELSVQGGTKTRLRLILEDKGDPAEDRRELLYRIVNGDDFLKHAGMYAGTEYARNTGMREIDQRIREMLNVSESLAEEIRKQIFLFAADHISKMPQHVELEYYGGVR